MRTLLLLLVLVCLPVSAIQITSFQKTVAASATAECIVDSTSALRAPDVAIQALSTNSGGVWVGDSSVTSSGPGVRITAGQTVSLEGYHARGTNQFFTLKDICLAVESNGEGVTVTYTVSNP